MSASEIELTFIRCSSCKSLMPSTANRCGMCGMDLMNSEASQPKKNQVPVRDAIKETRNQEVTQEIERIDQVPLKEDKFRVDSTRQEKKSAVLNFAKEMKVISKNNELPKEKNPPTADELRNNFLDQFDEEEDVEDDYLDNRYATVPSYDSEKSFTENTPIEKKPTENISNDNFLEARPLKKKKRRKKKKRISEINNSMAENVTHNIQPEEIKREPVPFKETEVVAREPVEIKEYNQIKETKIEQTIKQPVLKELGNVMNNQLVGWFVSYSIEQTGKAFEIREGRKFIGRQQLRSFDLVIPDSAVSTPHCLLQVDEHGVHLQDLMSDQGTFIKKQNDREFKKIETSILLKHGDVLRLGSFELIVCLIP